MSISLLKLFRNGNILGGKTEETIPHGGDLLMNIWFDICAAGFVLFPSTSIRRLLSNDGDGLIPV